MAKTDVLNFRISSGLKSIIGRDLITDDFIAVFELVKNSYDAGAKKVKIIFKSVESQDKANITILDNGKGMDLKDINDKWLFVAYSAKKEGEEDDYRNKITLKRYYAGAKGIGRFSCDRLGRSLHLRSLKNKSDSRVEILNVNWKDFEIDAKEDFIKIDVAHSSEKKNSFPYSSGTSLEIFELNSKWDKDKILDLKTSLSKLILPTLHSEKTNGSFQIEVVAEEFNDVDKEYIASAKEKKETSDPRKLVNGFVKNFIFETLNLKTTQIQATVSQEFITTTLTDRGEFVYEIIERNNYELLHSVSYHMFFLNQSAKTNFTQIMGIQPINYGNVFVYKNGFRVIPYGNERDDSMGLDARKTQGTRRFLGTRELIGRLEITGDNDQLKETSSRDGGLIKTVTYSQFVDCFYKILRRLEKYVVDAKEWGVDDESLKDLKDDASKESLVKLLANISAEKDLVSVKYNTKIFEIVNDQQEDSAAKIIKNFKRLASETNNSDLGKKATLLERKVRSLQKAKEQAEYGEVAKERELRQVNSENLFLKSVSTNETKEIISLQHHIDHAAERINRNLDHLKKAIESGADKSELYSFIEIISLENNKISALSRFVTKANFNLMANTINNDLIEFITEYSLNVYKEYSHLKVNNQSLDIKIIQQRGMTFLAKFKPLEIIIIIDNLINNSQKAKAKHIDISFEKRGDSELTIKFKDDGVGISDSIIKKIFDFGFTTTTGSGLGLYHVKQIVEKMNGSITVNNDQRKGVEFIIKLKR